MLDGRGKSRMARVSSGLGRNPLEDISYPAKIAIFFANAVFFLLKDTLLLSAVLHKSRTKATCSLYELEYTTKSSMHRAIFGMWPNMSENRRP